MHSLIQKLVKTSPKLLTLAQSEEVEIRRQDGSLFSLKAKCKAAKSPFDVPGADVNATTEDILEAVRQSRAD